MSALVSRPEEPKEEPQASSPTKRGPAGVKVVKCLVPGCEVESQSGFNLRHKICTEHQRMESVLVDGVKQRFCQQCTKLHPIEKFSGTNRGCRERLERHNQRRQMRKKLTAALENDGGDPIQAANLSEKDILDLALKLQADNSQQRSGSGMKTGSKVSAWQAENGEEKQQSSRGKKSQKTAHESGGHVKEDDQMPFPHNGLGHPLSQARNPDIYHQPSKSIERGPNGSLAYPLSRAHGPDLYRHATDSIEHEPSGDFDRPVSRTRDSDLRRHTTDAERERSGSLAHPLSRPGELDLYHHAANSIERETRGHHCGGCGGRGCFLCQRHSGMSPSGRALLDRMPYGLQHGPTKDEEKIFNISMKLMGVTPDQLPHHLSREIRTWLRLAPDSIRGFIRPGCVHLTIDISFHTDEDFQEALMTVPAGFAASVASGDTSLPWCTVPTVVWLPNKVLKVEAGQVVEENPRTDQGIAVDEVVPYPSKSPGAPQRMLVVGSGMLTPGVKLLCRTDEDGKWCTLELDTGNRSNHHLVAELPAELAPGRAWLELVIEGKGLQLAMSTALSLQLPLGPSAPSTSRLVSYGVRANQRSASCGRDVAMTKECESRPYHMQALF